MAPSVVLYTGLLAFMCIWKVDTQSMDQLIMMSQASSDDAGMFPDRDTVRLELDMLFTTEDYELMYTLDHDDETESRRKKRKAIKFDFRRWTDAEIPYVMNSDFSSNNLQEINVAINTWNRYTCIKFRPRTSGDNNFIRYRNGGGCSSFVGMAGGEQPINLAPGCRQRGIIMHEMGHALGFHHEQTRPDRDSYVRIIDQNISPSMRFNFQKHSKEVLDSHGVSYDYRSIMHYGKTAFTMNGEITIETLDPAFADVIGGRTTLSFNDVKLANIIYNCADHCGEKTCPGDGFVGKDCECWCSSSDDDTPATKCSDRGKSGNKGETGGKKGETGGNGICKDNQNSCSDYAFLANYRCHQAAFGAPKPAWMLENCRKSCRLCKGGETKGGTTSQPTTSCRDSHINCASWASRGECSRNPAYMRVNCKKSCNACGGISQSTCVDRNTNCDYWRRVGYCQHHAMQSYMKQNCAAACNFCSRSSSQRKPVCADKSSHCPYWASTGECYRNPAYMNTNCKKSCRKC